jgi:hypothetical protein
MDFFAGIDFSENTQEITENVGGGGQYIRDAGTYDVVIKMAYGLTSQSSSAKGIQLEMETKEGQKISWKNYFTNKEGQPTYIDKEGKKKNLPGYEKLMALCLLLNKNTQMPKAEIRTIKAFGKEMDSPVFTPWLNKTIGICVKRVLEDKYSNPSESTEYAEVQHFYDPVDSRFASEKPEAEPKKLKLFKEALEKDSSPIDKRKKSTGQSPQQAAAAKRPSF